MALPDRLRARGIAPTPWDEALARADRQAAVADPHRDLVDVDVPLPEAPGTPGFSPRGAVLALRALDVGADDRVLVAGPGGGYVAEVAGARAREACHVEELGEASDGPWDRLLWTRELREVPHLEAAILADLGTALVRLEAAEGAEVVKLVRSGEDVAQVRLDDAAPAGDPWGSRAGGASTDGRLAALLAFEGALQRAWTGVVQGMRERRWVEAVDDVWRADPPGDVAEARWDRARRFFRMGYGLQQATDLETAADAYEASLAMAASAEAHTFRGWVESLRGRPPEAIEWCERAIDVDPTLGNPYNDIGCYLLELGRVDEAEDWFRDALEADRYEAPHFPHLNLARVHLHRGEVEAAEEAALRSLELEPGDPAAEALLERIRERRG
jgi:Flp pilus assembly protein TadD